MESTDNMSAVLHAPKDLRLEQRQIPTVEEHEVLIRMESVGICGSDVHYWQCGSIGDFVLKAPMILGHESSGVVAEVGSRVKHLKVGDRIAIEPGVPCRRCEFCLAGRYNLCKDLVFCATPPYDGSLSRFYKHDADFCYKLPDHVSFDEGALLEPLSVAVHACRRAGVTAGDKVLVLGAGPIGLLNILTARAMGASAICVTDIAENRLAFAKSIGADHAVLVDSSDEVSLSDKIKEVLEGCPDKSIECSGADSSITLGIRITKSGGTMVLVGLGKPEVKIPLVDAAVREVDLRGIFRYANCYPTALSMIASRQIDVKPLVTHHFELEDTLKAFETSRSGDGGAIKVIIRCNK